MVQVYRHVHGIEPDGRDRHRLFVVVTENFDFFAHRAWQGFDFGVGELDLFKL